MTCAVPECEKHARSRGWCSTHYERWRRNGDLIPRKTPPMRGASLSARLWAKVDREGGVPEYAPHLGRCWVFVGSRDTGGYGLIARGGRTGNLRAHRVAYELTRGPIPDGLGIDHLCRVRHCVNPAHLEPVTNRENVIRGNVARALNQGAGLCEPSSSESRS